MKYMPGMFGHFEEWRVDRRDPCPQHLKASLARRRRRSK